MALVLRPPGTGELLTDRLADLGRARKWVSAARGVFALAAGTLGCVGLAGFLDAWLHLPALARGLALVTTLAVAGGLWLRGIVRPLTLRTDALSVALELEDRHPTLNDALASAVSFIAAGDGEGRGVSSRLQDAAVKSARRKADRHDFDRLVPTAACWRAGWACAAVVAVVLPLALANLGRAGTALTRLADPFGPHPWPTKTRVEILAPEHLPARLPKGDPFEVKFAVRGVIPDRAALTLRYGAGDDLTEQYPLTAGNDPTSPSAAVVSARLDPVKVSGPFSFRVTANDADTGWQKVDVVPPPHLVARDGRATPQFHLTPPAYTGLPGVNLPDGATVLEIPAGSGLRMRAASDLRLSSASLAYSGEKPPNGPVAGLLAVGELNPLAAAVLPSFAELVAADIPVSLSEDGRLLTAAFAPALSGPYTLRMTDESGLTGTRNIEIRLVADPAPTVTLLRPSAGRDPAVFTPAASLPIEVGADDKLYAVRRLFLEYRVGREGPVRTVPLAAADPGPTAFTAAFGGFGAFARVRPISAGLAQHIRVALFRRDDGSPVRDGDTLFLRGAADDWDDVTPAKEPGRSGEVELRVASADAIEAWLQRELAALRPELIRSRDQQREARLKALDATPQPDGTLAPPDRDRLLASEQVQRQVRGRVADPRDGLRAKADALRETVRANNLPRSNTTDRVEAVAEELDRLSDRELPVIEPTLAGARQVGALPPTPGQERAVREQLTKAGRHQKAVEDGLTNLLDLLAVWGGAAEIRGEARVLRDQVARQAAEVGKFEPKTSAADLERAGIRADQAAEQAGQLLTRAGRFAAEKEKLAGEARAAAADKGAEAATLAAKAAELPAGTPEKSALNGKAAALRAEAADLKAAADKAGAEAVALRTGVADAGGQALPNELRRAADDGRNNRPFEAAGLLNSAADRLGRLADALAEKENDAAPDLVKLKKAADDLDELAGAQDDLRKRAADAAKIADPQKREAALRALAAEQEKLIERARQVLQLLTRERADAAARDTRAALERMEAARGNLEGGEGGTRAQNEAVQRLDNARDRLDAATAAQPEHLADETRRKMADKVKALWEQQKAAVAEADRIHGLLARTKGWERDVQVSYIDIAEKREEVLAKDTRALEKEFAPFPVLARLLSEAAGGMETAAKRIPARVADTDPNLAFDPELEAAADRKVRRPMDLAARRLEQLLDALKPDDPKGKKPDPANPKGPKADGGGAGGGGGGGGNQDVVPPQAQLRVLRSLQAELNQLTAEFAKAHPDPDKLTEEEREELRELETAQRDIAALFEQMAKLLDEQKKGKPEPPESDKEKAP